MEDNQKPSTGPMMVPEAARKGSPKAFQRLRDNLRVTAGAKCSKGMWQVNRELLNAVLDEADRVVAENREQRHLVAVLNAQAKWALDETGAHHDRKWRYFRVAQNAAETYLEEGK